MMAGQRWSVLESRYRTPGIRSILHLAKKVRISNDRTFDFRTDRFEFRRIRGTEFEIGGGRSRIAVNATSCGSLRFRFHHARIPEVPPDRRRYADFSDMLTIRGLIIKDDACSNRANFEHQTKCLGKVETCTIDVFDAPLPIEKGRNRSLKFEMSR
ncbi:hypothetical protein [Rhizobium laguerreae]|uniref:hypothetical protein n=1 Tax=Rhizobium laguerreae TaxID=1076926 RepID=UPI001ABF6DB1|nr:hypothetical protein [Rhizobium laguerreae]